MPIITRLVQGKKNPNRVNLYLDGKFGFALSIDEVVTHHLKIGRELSDGEIEELVNGDNQSKVYGKILNFLSYRPRSVKEVRDRLYQYDLKDAEEQNLLIEKLKQKGYLDDLTFAKWFVESRNTHKLRSPAMIKQELAAKGVSKEILQQVISDIQDEKVTIKRLLDKKLGNSRALEGDERQKIILYLSRHGFPWEKIKQVVKSWESE